MKKRLRVISLHAPHNYIYNLAGFLPRLLKKKVTFSRYVLLRKVGFKKPFRDHNY